MSCIHFITLNITHLRTLIGYIQIYRVCPSATNEVGGGVAVTVRVERKCRSSEYGSSDESTHDRGTWQDMSFRVSQLYFIPPGCPRFICVERCCTFSIACLRGEESYDTHFLYILLTLCHSDFFFDFSV